MCVAYLSQFIPDLIYKVINDLLKTFLKWACLTGLVLYCLIFNVLMFYAVFKQKGALCYEKSFFDRLR